MFKLMGTVKAFLSYILAGISQKRVFSKASSVQVTQVLMGTERVFLDGSLEKRPFRRVRVDASPASLVSFQPALPPRGSANPCSLSIGLRCKGTSRFARQTAAKVHLEERENRIRQ